MSNLLPFPYRARGFIERFLASVFGPELAVGRETIFSEREKVSRPRRIGAVFFLEEDVDGRCWDCSRVAPVTECLRCWHLICRRCDAVQGGYCRSCWRRDHERQVGGHPGPRVLFEATK